MELARLGLVLLGVAVLALDAGNGHSPQTDILNFIKHASKDSKNIIYRDVNDKDIKFYMFNRAKPNGYRLYKDMQSLKKSGYNRAHPTKFLIHGYVGDYRGNAIQMPKNAYMAAGNYNVVAVDWSEYAFPYAVAVNSVRDVGQAVGDMITFMERAGGMRMSDVHIIGHSLGAHVAGYSGSSVRSKTKVGRITGLDPAAPAFSDNPPSERLGSEDAQFVDVIHTSIRVLGMSKNIGHADYYPSGGSRQPRCTEDGSEDIVGSCDHGEAYVYFTETIRNRHSYPGVSCRSVDEATERRCNGRNRGFMGEEAIRSPRGIYYVNVRHVKSSGKSSRGTNKWH